MYHDAIATGPGAFKSREEQRHGSGADGRRDESHTLWRDDVAIQVILVADECRSSGVADVVDQDAVLTFHADEREDASAIVANGERLRLRSFVIGAGVPVREQTVVHVVISRGKHGKRRLQATAIPHQRSGVGIPDGNGTCANHGWDVNVTIDVSVTIHE